jgi:uncharacterized lipoprotein YajG
MKGRNSHPYNIVSLMVAILLVTGCTPIIMKTSEFSTLQTGSPLRGVPAKTFAFKEFKDIRNAEDPSLIMEWRGHKFVLDQPPAVLVALWVKKELERNGHKCVTFSPDVKADFIVEGSIYKYKVITYEGMFSATQNANAGVKIMISCIPTEKGVFAKSYEGEYFVDCGSIGCGLNKWKIPVNQALVSMIKEMSTDTELIEFIKK